MERCEVHIKHLPDTGVSKDWNDEEALKTGAKILSGDLLMTHTRRTRGGVRESLPRARTHLCLQQRRMLTTRR